LTDKEIHAMHRPIGKPDGRLPEYSRFALFGTVKIIPALR
jgi:hypothetical protein